MKETIPMVEMSMLGETTMLDEVIGEVVVTMMEGLQDQLLERLEYVDNF